MRHFFLFSSSPRRGGESFRKDPTRLPLFFFCLFLFLPVSSFFLPLPPLSERSNKGMAKSGKGSKEGDDRPRVSCIIISPHIPPPSFPDFASVVAASEGPHFAIFAYPLSSLSLSLSLSPCHCCNDPVHTHTHILYQKIGQERVKSGGGEGRGLLLLMG